MHIQLEGQILCGCECNLGCDEPLYGRVIGQIEEYNGTLQCASTLEILHEHLRFLACNAHACKDHGKFFYLAYHLGLPGQLKGDFVMR